jgi:hypothetical protein
MAAAAVPLTLRILVDRPVPVVAYALQAKDGGALTPQVSGDGAPLAFAVPLRVAADGRVSGDQVRREGAVRRFVYLRVGQLAGDPGSPWSRRIKVDIHDLGALAEQAIASGGAIELVIPGTGADGTPACATVRPLARRVVPI